MAIVRHHARQSTTNTQLNVVERVVATTISATLNQAAFIKAVWDVRDITGQSAYDKASAYLIAKAK